MGLYTKWRKKGLRDEDGVIVAADVMQEWLLPWWWEIYRTHNSLPVTFFDFGMSLSMQKWCKERGEYAALPIGGDLVSLKEKVEPSLACQWEQRLGEKFWEMRVSWFKKPLACLQSPYRRTIWSDLDCEIRCSLAPLFRYCEKEPHISLNYYREYQTYNSGIVIFKRGSSALKSWAEEIFPISHLFRSDEDLFTHVVKEQKLKIDEIPHIYNWDFKNKDHSQAEIIHWYGPLGKNAIYQKIARY